MGDNIQRKDIKDYIREIDKIIEEQRKLRSEAKRNGKPAEEIQRLDDIVQNFKNNKSIFEGIDQQYSQLKQAIAEEESGSFREIFQRRPGELDYQYQNRENKFYEDRIKALNPMKSKMYEVERDLDQMKALVDNFKNAQVKQKADLRVRAPTPLKSNQEAESKNESKKRGMQQNPTQPTLDVESSPEGKKRKDNLKNK